MNLLEISQNNTLQIRELKTREVDGETISGFHRRTTDSTKDLTNEDALVKSIAGLFPFIEEVEHGEGGHKDVSLIRIDPANPAQFRYDITLHFVENGATVLRERKPPCIVKQGDDLSGLPEKAQKVANLLFA